MRVVQISQTQKQFWIEMPQYSGVSGSFFTCAWADTDSFVFSGAVYTYWPGGVYIAPTSLFAWEPDAIEVGQIQPSGSLLKLKGGSSGCVVNDSNNNMILDVNSAGVSSMRNMSVLVNSTEATFRITNTSGAGLASHYLTAAGVRY